MVKHSDVLKENRPRWYGNQIRGEDDTDPATLLINLDLSDLDMMTIRDLVRLGPEPQDACLFGLLGLMFAALAEGSLCICLDDDRFFERFSNVTGLNIADLVDGFVRRLNAGCYDALIRRGAEGDYKPLVLDSSIGHPLLYFQKFHYHERRLKHRLENFLSLTPDKPASTITIEAVLEDLYRDGAVIRKGPGADPIVRDPYQVEAIRAAMVQPLLVVSGGPGTGKTSMLANMLRALVRTGRDPARIYLAAPTGRAAQRMGEALTANLNSIAEPDPSDLQLIALRGATLHKLLAYSGRMGQFTYNERRFIPADVIVVDEVSMVDVVMMDRLFQAIDPARTRVILLGDKDQLPSVDAGAVLADIKPATDDTSSPHFVALHTVYRSGGELLKLARSINSAAPIPLQPVTFGQALELPDDRWAFVDSDTQGNTDRLVDQWCRCRYVQPSKDGEESYVDLVIKLKQLRNRNEPGTEDERNVLMLKLLGVANKFKVLTLVRNGPRGVGRLNARIAVSLRQIVDADRQIDNRLFMGALIMITRNDYRLGLTNGDIGVVMAQNDEGYQAFFNRSGKLTAIPAGRLTNWDLAFAITVHKSQGAEFKDALLLLPEDSTHRLLTREIVYTAATRAARSLIVYGSTTAFQTALRRKIVRQSGLVINSTSTTR